MVYLPITCLFGGRTFTNPAFQPHDPIPSPVAGRTFTNPAFQPHDDITVESTTATLERQHQEQVISTKVFAGGSGRKQMFWEAPQNVIYSFYDGANVVHFAYGPTAGGKTYTMQGPLRCPGAVPRTLDRLFRRLLSQFPDGVIRSSFRGYLAFREAREEPAANILGGCAAGDSGSKGGPGYAWVPKATIKAVWWATMHTSLPPSSPPATDAASRYRCVHWPAPAAPHLPG
ncbi:hypothetical protein HPB52_018840 [Rhipicephalus sanguineus]|uniref:Kinesin motor domain-containing protein n=1 Tax=Rhipicephalus sanguineus TaxID=34632 RepID=A0A9D4TBE1_RHISA|nr:hypothetical protein HPB52_018840 [Rhipicephalus sanguineus]